MNLYETVQALEAKNITVAINLGEHTNCSIDSNCPVAIELRRLVIEAGITLEQLLEGFETVTARPLAYTLPNFSSKTLIKVAGKVIEIDLNDVIEGELKARIEEKIRELDSLKGSVNGVGKHLFESYLDAMRRAKQIKQLPQLECGRTELIKSMCLINSSMGNYVFLFPFVYNPDCLVSGGTRYKMSEEDIAAVKRQAFIELVATRDGKILSARVLRDTGNKLTHYHGNEGGDCWGSVRIPERWDGTLTSLIRLKCTLVGSLQTINLNSILRHDPPSMPHTDMLRERSTTLGREGELSRPSRGRRGTGAGWAGRDENGDVYEDEPEEEEEEHEDEDHDEGWRTTQGEATARNAWGVGRRGRRQQPTRGQPPEVLAGEMVRRFGTPEAPENLDTVCAVCGERYGSHFGGYGSPIECPRDHNRNRTPGARTPEAERLRRWGITTAPTDMTQICALCGMEAGVHFQMGLICPPDHRTLTRDEEMIRRFGVATVTGDPTCLLCGQTYGRHTGWRCP